MTGITLQPESHGTYGTPHKLTVAEWSVTILVTVLIFVVVIVPALKMFTTENRAEEDRP